ncbi:hypothetical protein [Chloroflexus sp.]|uniref:hypothetical protein n=1 Tax=Chloroflexus sp. TaxID=1904827 RepID=UPI002ADE4AD9|nr:hypothetical protein [Chloroflexus sp.]
MQLSSESAFDHFNHVYDCVKTSFDELRQEASKLFRHPSTSIKWHFFLVFAAVLGFWFIISTPLADYLINYFSIDDFNLDTPFRWLVAIAGFVIWTLFVASICHYIYRYLNKKPFLLLAGNTFILPAIPITVLIILNLIATQNITSTLNDYIIFSIISFFGWLVLFAMCLVTVNIPLIIFLIFSSMNNNKEGRLIPSYTHITRHATRRIMTDIEKFTTVDWQQVECITKWKFDGINGRLQAFSFGIAGFGFLSILALFFSSEEIRAFQAQFWGIIAQLMGIPAEEEAGIQLLTVLIGIIVLLALIYFSRAYAELRYLETIGIICSLAQQQGQQIVASPLLAEQTIAHTQKPASLATTNQHAASEAVAEAPLTTGSSTPTHSVSTDTQSDLVTTKTPPIASTNLSAPTSGDVAPSDREPVVLPVQYAEPSASDDQRLSSAEDPSQHPSNTKS